MTITNRRKCTRSAEIDQLCDYCEIKITDKFVYQTETGLFLCIDCCHHFETMSNVFEEAAERILLGNVL